MRNLFLGTITFKDLQVKGTLFENYSLFISTEAMIKELNLYDVFNSSHEIIINNSQYYYKIDVLIKDCELGQFFDNDKYLYILVKNRMFFNLNSLICIQCSAGQYNINKNIRFCKSCPENGICINGLINAKQGNFFNIVQKLIKKY